MELQENKYKMMENATVTDRNIATESSVWLKQQYMVR